MDFVAEEADRGGKVAVVPEGRDDAVVLVHRGGEEGGALVDPGVEGGVGERAGAERAPARGEAGAELRRVVEEAREEGVGEGRGPARGGERGDAAGEERLVVVPRQEEPAAVLRAEPEVLVGDAAVLVAGATYQNLEV